MTLSRVWVLFCLVASLAPSLYQCKYYFVTQSPSTFDDGKNACASISTTFSIAKQCQPDNLAAMPYIPVLDQTYIWISSEKSCRPGLYPALGVDSSKTRPVTLVCRLRAERNLVMCETNTQPPAQNAGNNLVTVDIPGIPNDLTCFRRWVRIRDQEFMVVLQLMSFKEATMYCSIMLHGNLMNIRYAATNDTSFLQLSPLVPFYWIATPIPGNTSYAYSLLQNGHVDQKLRTLESESICQREYRTTPPPSSTSPMTTVTTKQTTAAPSTTTNSPGTCNSPKMSGIFRHQPQFDGFVALGNVLETSNAWNVMICTRKCSMNVACHAFFYDVISNECQLLGKSVEDTDSLEKRVNTSYYARI